MNNSYCFKDYLSSTFDFSIKSWLLSNVKYVFNLVFGYQTLIIIILASLIPFVLQRYIAIPGDLEVNPILQSLSTTTQSLVQVLGLFGAMLILSYQLIKSSFYKYFFERKLLHHTIPILGFLYIYSSLYGILTISVFSTNFTLGYLLYIFSIFLFAVCLLYLIPLTVVIINTLDTTNNIFLLLNSVNMDDARHFSNIVPNLIDNSLRDHDDFVTVLANLGSNAVVRSEYEDVGAILTGLREYLVVRVKTFNAEDKELYLPVVLYILDSISDSAVEKKDTVILKATLKTYSSVNINTYIDDGKGKMRLTWDKMQRFRESFSNLIESALDFKNPAQAMLIWENFLEVIRDRLAQNPYPSYPDIYEFEKVGDKQVYQGKYHHSDESGWNRIILSVYTMTDMLFCELLCQKDHASIFKIFDKLLEFAEALINLASYSPLMKKEMISVVVGLYLSCKKEINKDAFSKLENKFIKLKEQCLKDRLAINGIECTF